LIFRFQMLLVGPIYGSTSSASRAELDVMTAGTEEPLAASWLLDRARFECSNHLRLPTRVSKCGAMVDTSWPAVIIVLRILLR
jgi:hypothetical protein